MPPIVIENERANFKSLILRNPNHFGTFPNLGFKVVKAIAQNKSYEELTCIGLHPQGNRLQAVVNIKKNVGYDGGTCMEGSIEYVRFFVRRGRVWHDLGVTSFTSHDLPAGPLPVSYSVEMALDEARKYCTVENIVDVRGILSWNHEPPANDPAWVPVWGNVLDVKVQIAPKSLLHVPLQELIQDKLVTIDPSILETVDLSGLLAPKPAPEPPPYTVLKAKYEGKSVPGHRIGFTELQKIGRQLPSVSVLRKAAALRTKPEAPAGLELAAFLSSQIELAPNLAAILGDLPSFADEWLKTTGDKTFEELDCVGYNPETRMLSGVLTIKRNSGYSGSLCDPGSTEHVGFWGFIDGAWQSLGSAQVQVHDLAAVSAGSPVKYAVFRGANLPERLCGTVQAIPIRAILSWQTPPTGPDFVPVWGNVVNTNVQPIISEVPLGDQRARLMRINRVTVTKIDADGFAQASDIAGDCPNGNNSPFGGPLFLEGDFTVKSDVYFHPVTGEILPGQHPPAYKVFVQKDGAAVATQLVNSFNIAVFPVSPPAAHPVVTVTQSIQNIGGQQLYLYREGVVQAVNPRMLAVWEASGFEDGKYTLRVEGFVWNGVSYVPMATPAQTQRVHLYNGYLHTELDSHGNSFQVKRPQLELHISSPGGDCGDVKVGDPISGTYKVGDDFFGAMSLGVVQITIAGVPQPINGVDFTMVPSPTGGADGREGTWTLQTAANPADPGDRNMVPCGYTLVLSSYDRALVGSSCQGHYNQVAVGFCLRKP